MRLFSSNRRAELVVADDGTAPRRAALTLVLVGAQTGAAAVTGAVGRQESAVESATGAYNSGTVALAEGDEVSPARHYERARAIDLDGSLASRVPAGVSVPTSCVGTAFVPAMSVDR